MQRRADRSEAVGTLEQMQRLADGSRAVAQLKQITPGKLNVAGENHPQTDDREELEKAFAVDRSKSDGYWREQDFTIHEDEKDQVELEEPVMRGDPDALRVENIARLLEDTDIEAMATPANWFPFLRRLTGRVRSWVRGARRIAMAQAGWAGPSKEQGRALEDVEALLEVMDGLHEAAKPPKKKRFHKSPKPVVAVPEDVEKLQVLAAAALASTKAHILGVEDLRDFDVVARARSDRMHEVAALAERKGLKGVWKIGDHHVTDIANQHADEVDYQLLSLVEFNAELKSWKKKRKK